MLGAQQQFYADVLGFEDHHRRAGAVRVHAGAGVGEPP